MGRRNHAPLPWISRYGRVTRVASQQLASQPAAVAIASTMAAAISTHSRCCCLWPEPTTRRLTPSALHYALFLLPITDSRHKLRRIRISLHLILCKAGTCVLKI